MKKKSGVWMTVLILIVFLAGLALLLYPIVSDYWNSLRQARSISDYSETVAGLEQTRSHTLWEAAVEYNTRAAQRNGRTELTEAELEEYYSTLTTDESSLIGYLEIPRIDCMLPIGHGTGDDVLRDSVGHLEWSSLPVGGANTHCVLSGHSGLPSAQLLTDLALMEQGDLFYLHVLGEILTYQVDNIAVVTPDDLSLLGISAGEDYVTLLTCTPYGINSHRLLVRGTRVQTETETEIDAENTLDRPSPGKTRGLDPLYLIPAFLLALIVGVLVYLMLSVKPRKKRKKEEQTSEGMEKNVE